MIFIYGDSFADPGPIESCNNWKKYATDEDKHLKDYLWYNNLGEETYNWGKSGAGPIYVMGKVYHCIENELIGKDDKLVVILPTPTRETHYDGMHAKMCLTNYLYFLKTYSERTERKVIAFTAFDNVNQDNLDSKWFRYYREKMLVHVSVGERYGEKFRNRYLPNEFYETEYDMRSNHLGEKNHRALSVIIRNHLFDENNEENLGAGSVVPATRPQGDFIYDEELFK